MFLVTGKADAVSVTATKTFLKSYCYGKDYITCANISPNGQFIAIGLINNNNNNISNCVNLWNTTTNRHLKTFNEKFCGKVDSIKFYANKKLLVGFTKSLSNYTNITSDNKYALVIWHCGKDWYCSKELKTQVCFPLCFPSPSSITSVDVTEDGRVLGIAFENNSFLFVDLEKIGKEITLDMLNVKNCNFKLYGRKCSMNNSGSLVLIESTCINDTCIKSLRFSKGSSISCFTCETIEIEKETKNQEPVFWKASNLFNKNNLHENIKQIYLPKKSSPNNILNIPENINFKTKRILKKPRNFNLNKVKIEPNGQVYFCFSDRIEKHNIYTLNNINHFVYTLGPQKTFGTKNPLADLFITEVDENQGILYTVGHNKKNLLFDKNYNRMSFNLYNCMSLNLYNLEKDNKNPVCEIQFCNSDEYTFRSIHACRFTSKNNALLLSEFTSKHEKFLMLIQLSFLSDKKNIFNELVTREYEHTSQTTFANNLKNDPSLYNLNIDGVNKDVKISKIQQTKKHYANSLI